MRWWMWRNLFTFSLHSDSSSLGDCFWSLWMCVQTSGGKCGHYFGKCKPEREKECEQKRKEWERIFIFPSSQLNHSWRIDEMQNRVSVFLFVAFSDFWFYLVMFFLLLTQLLRGYGENPFCFFVIEIEIICDNSLHPSHLDLRRTAG